MTTPTPTYRIVRIADPRSRGACYWFEIEGLAADGSRWHVATCDDRREARELVRQIEAADAAKAAAISDPPGFTLAPLDEDAIVLDPCSPELAELDLLPDLAGLDARRAAAYRRLDAARRHAAAVRGARELTATRAALAAELRAARAEYDAAHAAFDFLTP